MTSAPTGSEPRIVYADSSALVKLLADEPETLALERHLLSDGRSLVSSALAQVEVFRAARLAGTVGEAATKTRLLLDEVGILALSDAVLARAARLDPPALRSLDAIHLASALELGVAEMLVYDHRLADAARSQGITVSSPGA